MEKKSNKAAETADVKKQLEALAGHEIDVTAEQLRGLRYPVGSYSSGDGTAIWQSVVIFLGKSCIPVTLLDVSGVSSTGADGTAVVALSKFLCSSLNSLSEPTNVVATPRTTSPSFLTMTHSLINSSSDVQINVFTWDPNGNPAPNVVFDWRCRVVSIPIIE